MSTKNKIEAIIEKAAKEEKETCSMSIPKAVLNDFREFCKNNKLKVSDVITEFMKDVIKSKK